jgi:hypothetical protein
VGRRLLWLVLAAMCACLPLANAPAADRGIGGTGGPATGPAISDRGIGGTGIVGVITGFGSVFVNGLEVAYTPTTPMTVDGEAEPNAALEVGQLAAIVASGDPGLDAVSIDVRHEVSGPVTSVSADFGTAGSTLVVAGQQVAIDSGTEGLKGPDGQGLGGLEIVHPGDWVAVSGLRGPDGVIAASRIDRRVPGTILVRGPVTPRAGRWWIGDLSVLPSSGVRVARGAIITARGVMVNGALSMTAAEPDVLSSDPAAFFGGHVRRMVIENYVSAAGGHVRLGRGWFVAPAQGLVVPAGAHRAIVEFERGAHGDFVATHLRGAGRPFEPRRGPFGPERGAPERGAPERGGPERHGSLGPFHPSAHAFGPAHFQPHPWQDRHPGFGRGGFGRGGFGRGGHGRRRPG